MKLVVNHRTMLHRYFTWVALLCLVYHQSSSDAKVLRKTQPECKISSFRENGTKSHFILLRQALSRDNQISLWICQDELKINTNEPVIDCRDVMQSLMHFCNKTIYENQDELRNVLEKPLVFENICVPVFAGFSSIIIGCFFIWYKRRYIANKLSKSSCWKFLNRLHLHLRAKKRFSNPEQSPVTNSYQPIANRHFHEESDPSYLTTAKRDFTGLNFGNDSTKSGQGTDKNSSVVFFSPECGAGHIFKKSTNSYQQLENSSNVTKNRNAFTPQEAYGNVYSQKFVNCRNISEDRKTHSPVLMSDQPCVKVDNCFGKSEILSIPENYSPCCVISPTFVTDPSFTNEQKQYSSVVNSNRIDHAYGLPDSKQELVRCGDTDHRYDDDKISVQTNSTEHPCSNDGNGVCADFVKKREWNETAQPLRLSFSNNCVEEYSSQNGDIIHAFSNSGRDFENVQPNSDIASINTSCPKSESLDTNVHSIHIAAEQNKGIFRKIYSPTPKGVKVAHGFGKNEILSIRENVPFCRVNSTTFVSDQNFTNDHHPYSSVIDSDRIDHASGLSDSKQTLVRSGYTDHRYNKNQLSVETNGTQHHRTDADNRACTDFVQNWVNNETAQPQLPVKQALDENESVNSLGSESYDTAFLNQSTEQVQNSSEINGDEELPPSRNSPTGSVLSFYSAPYSSATPSLNSESSGYDEGSNTS